VTPAKAYAPAVLLGRALLKEAGLHSSGSLVGMSASVSESRLGIDVTAEPGVRRRRKCGTGRGQSMSPSARARLTASARLWTPSFL
jgi:hypothetical protein